MPTSGQATLLGPGYSCENSMNAYALMGATAANALSGQTTTGSHARSTADDPFVRSQVNYGVFQILSLVSDACTRSRAELVSTAYWFDRQHADAPHAHRAASHVRRAAKPPLCTPPVSAVW